MTFCSGASLQLLKKLKLNDMSLEFLQSVNKTCQDFMTRALGYLNNTSISPHHKKYLRMLKYEAETCIRGYNRWGH